MDRFLLHCLLLAWASLAAAWRLTPRRADRFLATTLLAWANVVVTALVLGTLHRLNEPRGFFLVSALLAALTCLLAVRRRERPAATEGEDSPGRWLQLACILALAPLAAANVMAADHYGPGNPESMTQYLPRALFYLGQGHLGHFDSGDPRQVLLPFNYNLLQVFGLVYSPPAQCLNFFNLLAWLAAGAVFAVMVASGVFQVRSYRQNPYFDSGLSPAGNWRALSAGLVRLLRPGDVVLTQDFLHAWTLTFTRSLPNQVLPLKNLTPGPYARVDRLVYLESDSSLSARSEIVARLASLGFGAVQVAELRTADAAESIPDWHVLIFQRP